MNDKKKKILTWAIYIFGTLIFSVFVYFHNNRQIEFKQNQVPIIVEPTKNSEYKDDIFGVINSMNDLSKETNLTFMHYEIRLNILFAAFGMLQEKYEEEIRSGKIIYNQEENIFGKVSLYIVNCHYFAHMLWKEHLDEVMILSGVLEETSDQTNHTFQLLIRIANKGKSNFDKIVFNPLIWSSVESLIGIKFNTSSWGDVVSFRKILIEVYGKNTNIEMLDMDGESLDDIDVFIVDMKKVRQQLWEHAYLLEKNLR